MECRYCSILKKSSRSLQQHEIRCPSNPTAVPLWNKGLTKSDDHRLATLSVVASIRQTGKKRTTPSPLKGKETGKGGRSLTVELEQERRLKIREAALRRNLGGYQPGSGRGKKGWYKGIFCDSSWELAYVIYCIDHQIDIKRNTTKLTYIWKEKTRTYIPDFLVNGNLVEIKGYRTEQWEAKLAACPGISVLYESEMRPILRYVLDKYGKDYILMYE